MKASEKQKLRGKKDIWRSVHTAVWSWELTDALPASLTTGMACGRRRWVGRRKQDRAARPQYLSVFWTTAEWNKSQSTALSPHLPSVLTQSSHRAHLQLNTANAGRPHRALPGLWNEHVPPPARVWPPQEQESVVSSVELAQDDAHSPAPQIQPPWLTIGPPLPGQLG